MQGVEVWKSVKALLGPRKKIGYKGFDGAGRLAQISMDRIMNAEWLFTG
jgi:hypothetical protein